MRTLHVCYSFLPDPPGGTEIYVESLCRELATLGIGATIAAPGAANRAYEIDGLRVRRFACGDSLDLTALYGGDPHAAANFGRLLDEEQPDLVHLHALTPACSPLLAGEVKLRGLPLVYTYHTPTATCQRGTLLEWGRAACDGRLDVSRCTACALDGLGTGRLPGLMLAAMPADGGNLLGKFGREGGAWTALRMSSLVTRRFAGLEQFFADVDRFVVLTPWVERVLRNNGVGDQKLVRSAHGLALPPPASARRKAAGERLRIIHLGRVDPVKGTDLLIRALRASRTADIDLDIYGVVQSGANGLLDRLQSLAAGDARIRFLPPIPPSDVIERIGDYDMLAVPSQWMETGPLVVLEGFAAGVPVLGSALGGIEARVTDEVDGLLVRPFNSEGAWTVALQRCAADPALVARLAGNVRPPRSPQAVAADMSALYGSLLQSARSADVDSDRVPVRVR